MKQAFLITALAAAASVIGTSATPDHRTVSADRTVELDTAEHLVYSRYSTGHTSTYPQTSQAAAVTTMIAHHQDAIDGSRLYLEHSTNPTIRAFAERVIRVQTDQIDQMNTWLDDHGGRDATPAWAPVFCTIDNWGSDDGYLTTMIAHHQAAIAMYQSYIVNGTVTDPTIGLLLRDIGKGQTGEIEWMHQQHGDRT